MTKSSRFPISTHYGSNGSSLDHSSLGLRGHQRLNATPDRTRIGTNDFVDFLSLFEKVKGGHGASPNLLCDVGNSFDVNLVELHVGVLLAEFLDLGGDQAAGSTPWGPGIEYD